METVLCDMKLDYLQLLEALRVIFVENGATLPDDVAKMIASYLTVHPVNNDEVTVTRASSASTSRGSSLKGVLDAKNDNSWWISRPGSMPRGLGSEYLQYQLCPNLTVRRLESVFIKIPPLPYGPLSVRLFQVDSTIRKNSRDATPTWVKASPVWHVENKSGLQRFDFPKPGIDATDVRIVCLSNQMAHRFQDDVDEFDCVGFFASAFK